MQPIRSGWLASAPARTGQVGGGGVGMGGYIKRSRRLTQEGISQLLTELLLLLNDYNQSH